MLTEQVGTLAPGYEPAHWFRQVVIVCSALTIWHLSFAMLLPFTALYVLHELGVSSMNEAALYAAACSTALGATAGVFAPFWGGLADLFGRKLLLLRAVVGGMVAVGVMSVVQSPPQLVAVFVAAGALAGVSSAGPSMVAAIAPRPRAATALGLQQTAQQIASMVGPFAGGAAIASLGYRQMFATASGLMLVATVIIAVLVHEPADFQRAQVTSIRGATRGVGLDLLGLLRHRLFLIVGALSFTTSLLLSTSNPLLPLWIQQIFGADGIAERVGVLFGATALAGAAGAFAAGFLADRIGHRAVLLGAFMGSGIATAAHPVAAAAGFAPLLAVRIGYGLLQGATLPSLNAFVLYAVGRARQGSAFGLRATLMLIGSAAGPPVGAAIAVSLGIDTLLIASGIASLVVGVLLLPLVRLGGTEATSG